MYLKKSNTSDNPNSTYTMSVEGNSCCGEKGTVCKNIYPVDFMENWVGLNIDGTLYNFAADATNIAEVKAAMGAALEAAGYVDLENSGVRMSGSNLIIYTTATLGDAERTGSTVVNTGGNLCTEITYCTYAATLVDAITIEYNGASQTLDNSPYAYSGTPATDATTAGTLATDFAAELTALSVPFVSGSVTVTVNDTAEGYDISFIASNAKAVTAGGDVVFIQSDCYADYVA